MAKRNRTKPAKRRGKKGHTRRNAKVRSETKEMDLDILEDAALEQPLFEDTAPMHKERSTSDQTRERLRKLIAARQSVRAKTQGGGNRQQRAARRAMQVAMEHGASTTARAYGVDLAAAPDPNTVGAKTMKAIKSSIS